MKKKFRYFKIISILIATLLISLSCVKVNALTLKEPTEPPSPSANLRLVFDNENISSLPEKFRKTSDLSKICNNKNFSTTGLEKLNISGSQQFSRCNFPILINALDTNLPIIIYDLRQESHGFINDFPISYEGEKNTANKGLTDAEVLEIEKKLLDSIKLNTPITISNAHEKSIIPESVMDEHTLVNEHNLNYVRIFATDEELPSNAVIDSFVKNINEISQESWLHFHCKEGIGRTTTFMIFYDMMKNYKNVSAKDIILRQLAIADFNENDINLLVSEKRIALYDNFYNYCKKFGDDFKTPFSQYNENK